MRKNLANMIEAQKLGSENFTGVNRKRWIAVCCGSDSVYPRIQVLLALSWEINTTCLSITGFRSTTVLLSLERRFLRFGNAIR